MRGLGRTFSWFWTASAVSALGDGLLVTGLPLLTRSVTHSPTLIASVFAAGRLPWAFALLIGAAVDHRDARRVMIAMDLLRGALLAGLGMYLVVSDRLPSVAVICLLALVLSACAVAFFAGVQRTIPTIVGPGDLERANGYLQAAIGTGDQFIGPALGGAFAAGGKIPLLGDAVSFFASALALRKLPRLEPIVRPGRFGAEVGRGWAWFRGSAPLRMLTLSTTITGALSTFVLATEVVIVTDTLGLSSYWLGPFTAIIATGGILGTLFGARAVARLGSTTQPVAVFITSICYLGCVGNRSPAVLFLLLGVQSFAVGMTNVASASVRQRAIPADLRGRVGGLSRSFIFGCQVPGALLGGWLATQWGTDTMFAIAGLGLLVLAALTARSLRHLLEPFQPTVPLGT